MKGYDLKRQRDIEIKFFYSFADLSIGVLGGI